MFCAGAYSQSGNSDSPIQLNVLGTHTDLTNGNCFASELVLEGPYDLCPGQLTYVNLEDENIFPSSGGQGIRFTNYDNVDFVISGMDFPYSFDNDINGILSANNIDPLEGFFNIYTVVFTNAGNVTGSICSESSSSINLFFNAEGSPVCDQDPCFAHALTLIGPSEVCPTGSTIVDVQNPNNIPQNGGEGIKIRDGVDLDVIAVITDIEFPFEINNDLNGYLSNIGLDPLEGSFYFNAVVYLDSEDPENSICWTGSSAEIEFLNAIHPDCIEGDCFAQDLTTIGTPSICPNEGVSINLININTVPEDGGEGVRFSNGSDIDFIVPVGEFPFAFDGGINGFLDQNDMNPLEGIFQLTSVVYYDPNNIENSLCSESTGSIDVEFIPGNDAECMECSAEWMFGGPGSVCPGETTTIYMGGATIPTGGDVGLKCIDAQGTEILLPDIEFPFVVDNDLNGFLSENDLDPYVGPVLFVGVIYTDPNDMASSICAESDAAMTVNFLAPDDISCVPCEVQPLEVLGPELLCPDETTLLDFIDEIIIPDGGGVGLRTHLSSFGTTIYFTDVSFPYTVDSDLGGYLSANDMEPAHGWIQFKPFIYADPEDPMNSICQLGEQTAVNFLYPDNSTCQEDCIVEDLVLTGSDEICTDETTSVNIAMTSIIPEGGGLGIKFSNGDDVNIIYSGMSFPYEFDSDLNGELSDSGFDPFEGEFMLTSFIYDDPNNANSICSESENPVVITFLAADDPGCILGISDYRASGQWTLYPNPAEEAFAIEFEAIKAGNVILQVIDLQGRALKSFNRSISPGIVNIPIDVNDISPGIYQVILNFSGSIDSKPLIILPK